MKYIFLDLEDTAITPVLEEWDQCELINIEKIQKIIEEEKPDTLGVFSFALQTQEDIKNFKNIIQPMLEQTYGLKVSHAPSIKNILDACGIMKTKNHVMKKEISFQDLRHFFGKSNAFKMYVKENFKPKFGATAQMKEFILIDDDVENETFSFQDHAISAKIVNIDSYQLIKQMSLSMK